MVMAQTFSKCWLLAGFAINQRAIAATLCENRNKPSSSCHGKCYLRKQMAAQDKQENAPLNGGKEKFEVLLFSEASKETPAEPIKVISTSFPAYTAAILERDRAAIFHPPRA